MLGIAAHQRGDYAAAAEHIAAAVAAAPDQPTFHDGLGVVRTVQGDLEAAEACHRRALELDPGAAVSWFNLGNVLRRAGRGEEAVEAYRRAIDLDPDHAEARLNLGVALLERGDLEAALAAHREALALSPGLAEAHNNLAAALLAQKRPDEAIEALRRALDTRADFPLAAVNLGGLQLDRGELAEALDSFRRAVALRPRVASLHFHLAFNLLKASRFADGWSEYEWRWGAGGRPPLKPGCPAPLWQGEPLAGRRILLVDEQGLGDTLQFIRYAPLVAARGATVVAECAPPLGRLLAGCPGIERLLVGGEPPPEVDFQIPLLSVPRWFTPDLDSIPAAVPYLATTDQPHPEAVAAIAAAPGLRVGVAWAGNPVFKADTLRSVAAERFAPLARLPGVTLLSLQFGERGAAGVAALREAAGDAGDAVVDLGPWLGDFAATAALVERLDLVVAVDTSIVHLAGALGRPVWTLLGPSPDWRWLSGRDDSPWYPTMRLFRHRREEGWEELFERVAAALAAEAGAARLSGGRRRAG